MVKSIIMGIHGNANSGKFLKQNNIAPFQFGRKCLPFLPKSWIHTCSVKSTIIVVKLCFENKFV